MDDNFLKGLDDLNKALADQLKPKPPPTQTQLVLMFLCSVVAIIIVFGAFVWSMRQIIGLFS